MRPFLILLLVTLLANTYSQTANAKGIIETSNTFDTQKESPLDHPMPWCSIPHKPIIHSPSNAPSAQCPE